MKNNSIILSAGVFTSILMVYVAINNGFWTKIICHKECNSNFKDDKISICVRSEMVKLQNYLLILNGTYRSE